MKRIIGRTLLGAALCLAQPAWGMDFRMADQVIYAVGNIVAGDTERLAEILKHSPASGPGSDNGYVLQLSSAGGDVAEGIRLGKALRAAQISTLITHDASCLGACALAFLGGTQTYATGVGIGRRLEFGGRLDFRGVIAPKGNGVAPAGPSPVAIAALAGYAEELRGIDFGRLVHLAASQTEDAVTQPRDILALSISLRGVPSKTPADWSTNACVAVVGKHLSALDDAAARVTGTATGIPSVKALRLAVMSGRADENPVARSLAALNDSDALDLALGGPFYLEQRKPILDARSIGLERGAGFYYDTCLAVRSKGMLAVGLLDGVSHRAILEDFGEDDAFLAMAGQQTRLW